MLGHLLEHDLQPSQFVLARSRPAILFLRFQILGCEICGHVYENSAVTVRLRLVYYILNAMNIGGNGNRDDRPEPSSISSTLLERVRARRPEAWQRLVKLYGPVVYGWCRQLGVSEADAADVVQEVFAAVTTGIARFRRDRPGDSFGAWLRTIMRNCVYDHFRRRQGQPSADGGTSAYQRLASIAEAEEESSLAAPVEKQCGFSRRLLELVRAEFEDRTWDAFWRIVVDGQSPAEVATALEMNLPAVYKAKSRVLRRLRQELGGLEGG